MKCSIGDSGKILKRGRREVSVMPRSLILVSILIFAFVAGAQTDEQEAQQELRSRARKDQN